MTFDGHEGSRDGARTSEPTEGRYRILSCLGRGGMAEVYLAVARGPGGVERLVVVKRLRSDLAGDASFRAMLVDEARVAARLRHDNVVHTYDVGQDETGLFLVMEYLEGQPLSRLFALAEERREPFEPKVAAFVVHEMLAGLHHAHTLEDFDGTPLGIVHRDVSPHNVFVTYDGHVKIVDFGIAKAVLSASVTEVGVLKGKAAYMAPECILAEATDARADVFSAGIVLWELLALERLYQGVASATLQKILSEPAPPLPNAGETASALEDVVAKALAKSPDDRFASARSMIVALEEALEIHPLEARATLAARMGTYFAADQERSRELVRSAFRAPSFRGSTDTGSMRTGTPTGSMPTRGAETPGSRTRGSWRTPWPGDVLADEDAATRVAPREEIRSLTYPSAPPMTRSTSDSGGVPTSRPGSLSASFLPSLLGRSTTRLRPRGLALVGGLALGGALVASLTLQRAGRREPTAPSSARSEGRGDGAPAPPPLLRLHGSNTIGAGLAPALVAAYLRHEGFTPMPPEPAAAPHTVLVRASTPTAAAIEIGAEGSSTAFEHLADGRCDIGLASRPPHPAERRLLEERGLGDMRGPASEHTLALDGIAVIVHPNRQVHDLSVADLQRFFSGQVPRWDDGGSGAPVHVYARDDASGTFDTFRNLVLGPRALAPDARRLSTSEEVADAVASDPAGVGFVGLAHVRSARAVAVRDEGIRPTFPTTFTVATETYPLTRRLYLYTPERPTNPHVQSFVRFALSPEGQAVVRQSGFVDLELRERPPSPCDGPCSPRYARLASRARRLSLDFRFRPGSSELDSRGARDIERLVAFLATRKNPRLSLLGFSDRVGDHASNVELSRQRARRVADELAAHGVPPFAIDGLGDEMPVAAGAGEDARAKNRRVEVWLEADP